MALSFLLFAGVLTTLLSGVNFFIRPYQRAQVQAFLEEVTLRAADLDPADFRMRIQEPGVQAVLVMVTYFELALFSITQLLYNPNLLLRATQLLFIGPYFDADTDRHLEMFQPAAFALIITTLFFAWRWPLPQAMRWILGCNARPWVIRMRYIGVLVLVYLLLGGCWVLVQSFIRDLFNVQDLQQRTAFTWILLPIWPLFTLLWVLLQGTGLALRPDSWMASRLFGLFKATMWRLVEYDKGAVAALALLLTMFLAVLKLRLG